ncbi:hypothetical protein OCU04_001618 [Sclerotinia nivalis]|uniref:Uncharacterized protein n=1 Tax=Sclerotinia nivalis TaxID=352851 RepID=A0A9X0DR77_9HELO|nr:hypothetical protein OCU04_001618 [Sclerotinia nivalis]
MAKYRAYCAFPNHEDVLFDLQMRAILAIVSPLMPVSHMESDSASARDLAFFTWFRMYNKTVDDFPTDVLRYLQTRILSYIARVNIGCTLVSLHSESQNIVSETIKIQCRPKQRLDQDLESRLVSIVLSLHMQISLALDHPFGNEWEFLLRNHDHQTAPPPDCFKFSWTYGCPPINTGESFEKKVLNDYWLSYFIANLEDQWDNLDPYERFEAILGKKTLPFESNVSQLSTHVAVMHLNRSKRSALTRRYHLLYKNDLAIFSDDPAAIFSNDATAIFSKDAAAMIPSDAISNYEVAIIHDHRALCYRDIRRYLLLLGLKGMESYRRLFCVMFQYDIQEAEAFLGLTESDIWNQPPTIDKPSKVVGANSYNVTIKKVEPDISEYTCVSRRFANRTESSGQSVCNAASRKIVRCSRIEKSSGQAAKRANRQNVRKINSIKKALEWKI